MTAPFSPDLRRRLVRAVEAGSPAREAARRFAVSAAAAIKLAQRVRETGSAAPAKIGGYRLWLRDTDGNEFYYAHLSAYSPLAVEGRTVDQSGQVYIRVEDASEANRAFTIHVGP